MERIRKHYKPTHPCISLATTSTLFKAYHKFYFELSFFIFWFKHRKSGFANTLDVTRQELKRFVSILIPYIDTEGYWWMNSGENISKTSLWIQILLIICKQESWKFQYLLNLWTWAHSTIIRERTKYLQS